MSKIVDTIGIFDYKHTVQRKRVGRGRGSGLGKTCGKGQKGQKSRTGVSIRAFEGGQTPLYVRLPRHGFTNIFRTEYVPINFDDISSYIESGVLKKEITVESLVNAKIIRKNDYIKVLNRGTCPNDLSIEAHAFSKTAIEAINKAGGSHSVLFRRDSKDIENEA